MAITPFGVIFGFLVAGMFLTECSGTAASDSDCVDAANASAPAVAPGDAPSAETCTGWRPPFFVLSALLLGPSLWFFFSRRKYVTPLSSKCCGDPPDASPPGSPSPASPSLVADAAHRGVIEGAPLLVRNARMLLLCLGAGVHTFQGTALIGFGPRFMERQLCVSKASASLLTGTLIPVISTGVFVGGYYPTARDWGPGKLRFHILLMVLTSLAAVPLVIATFLSNSIALFLVCCMFSMAFMFAMSSPSVTTVERVVAEHDRAAAVAVQNVAVRFGAVPGPIVLGSLLDAADTQGAERGAYVALGLGGLVGACLLWLAAWHLQGGPDLEDEREAAAAAEQEAAQGRASAEPPTEMRQLPPPPPVTVCPLNADGGRPTQPALHEPLLAATRI
eukprot:TRINITY_DN29764_c0_g1_i2.p2 TRINITY_DN29764_c0_g1~~TRINITY_DN29764_c0_g1_i2.p2  ORF type:complete len:391 (+),score=125.53 TRINITY_DN29764_c0_g1_i2:551-1723(+)